MQILTRIPALEKLIAAAEDRLLRLIAGENHAVADAIRCALDAMREELCAPDAPLTERLLADQILLGWLEVYSFQPGSVEMLRDEKLQRAYDRVIRRYQAAIFAHARLRKRNRTTATDDASPSNAPQPGADIKSAPLYTNQPVGGARRSAPQLDASTTHPQTPPRPTSSVAPTPMPAAARETNAHPASKHSRRRSRIRMKRQNASLSPDASQQHPQTAQLASAPTTAINALAATGEEPKIMDLKRQQPVEL